VMRVMRGFMLVLLRPWTDGASQGRARNSGSDTHNMGDSTVLRDARSL
jgi:hypothetical protein